jgi:hypothetical protein
VVGGLLSTVLLAVSGGCAGSGSNAGSAGLPGEPKSNDSANPDSGLLVSLRSAELGLIAQYDAVLARFPELSAQLSTMRADHAAHLSALGGSLPQTTPTPTPSAAPDAGQAVAALAEAEHSAANARIGDCGGAHDPVLARLVGAIGGCEAAHGWLLDELATHKPHPATKSPAPPKHPQETE